MDDRSLEHYAKFLEQHFNQADRKKKVSSPSGKSVAGYDVSHLPQFVSGNGINLSDYFKK